MNDVKQAEANMRAALADITTALESAGVKPISGNDVTAAVLAQMAHLGGLTTQIADLRRDLADLRTDLDNLAADFDDLYAK